MEKVLNKNGADYLIGKIKNYVNINVNCLQDEIDVVFDITNKFIDLGLPSGTLWAECNFGADKPYEYGKYAAFGEHKAYVFGEHSFDISSYTGSGIDADLTKDDDCINITMGGEYLIPSKEQFTELVQNTTREEISDYEGTGVKGILLTSNINGNKIFFPLPGYSTYKTRSYNEQYGYYVTTQYYNENQIKAVRLGGTSVNLNNDLSRITGISIRPVVNKEYYSLRIKDASSVLYENNTLDANNVKNALDKIVATQSLTSENIDNINKTIEEIELFKFPNVTIIGEPTIQSGQISNFSKTNYLQFPFILDLRDKSFEIDFCFTTNTNVTTQQNILDSKFGIALAIKDGKGLMAISSNGTSWDIGSSVGSFDIQPNTTYYAKLIWDKSRYVTKLSVDGTEYVEDMVLTSSIRPYPTTIFIGGCDTEETSHDTHPFFGTINMNKAILSVSGNIIWQGMDDAGLATRLAIDFSNIDEEGKTKVKEITNDKIYLTLFLLVDENTNEIKSKEIHDKDGNVMSYDDIKSLLDTHKVYIIYNLENRDNILQLVVNDDNQISFARTYGEESYVDTCFVDIYKDGGIENGIYTLMGEEQYHYFDDAIKKNTVLYLVYNTTENTLKDAKGKSVTFQDIYNKITTDGTTVKVYVDEMYEGALMSVSYVEESDIWFNQFDMDTQSNKVTNYYLILNDDDTYEFGQYGLAGKLTDKTKHSEVFNDTKNNIATGLYSHAEGHTTTASGESSHSEGNNTTASGDYSHSGGYDSVASGKASFAHGFGCYAKTNACTALGWSTIANRHQQVVIGQNNIEDTTDYMFIIGNGADNDYRHNALAVKDDGTIVTWINDEKIELSPSKIKELVEMENQFVVISSALNDLNERLNALSTTVTMNQTLQPIVYGANISSYDAGGAQTMDLDDEDYDGLVDMQSLDLDDDAESDIAPMSDDEESEN